MSQSTKQNLNWWLIFFGGGLFFSSCLNFLITHWTACLDMFLTSSSLVINFLVNKKYFLSVFSLTLFVGSAKAMGTCLWQQIANKKLPKDPSTFLVLSNTGPQGFLWRLEWWLYFQHQLLSIDFRDDDSYSD